MKFIQPVSMECSQEQYERDLKEPLLAMGYEQHRLTYNGYGDNFIATKVGGGNYDEKIVSDIYASVIEVHGRYFIDEYNPSLFLALAGMTDSETGNLGEWWCCTKGNRYFSVGNLYKQVNDNVLNTIAFIKIINDNLQLDGWASNNKTHFRKATQQEIINHFSNKETNKPMGKVTVKKSEFKPLYDAACSDWKTRFDNVLKPFVFTNEIEFTSDFVEEMRKACTKEQLMIFKEIFGDIYSSNPFAKEFNVYDIQETSTKLFGDELVLQITGTTLTKEINRPDLSGKSFYVPAKINVVLHSVKNGGTIIEFIKQ